jgi:epoxyqueuosine reductase QueG
MAGHITREELVSAAKKTGIDYIGFAPVSRWKEGDEVKPRSLWPEAKTVIVLGAPLWLPLIEASPSVLGREQYFVTDKLLEKAAYRLVVFLTGQGYGALNIPKYKTAAPEPSRTVLSVSSAEREGELPFFPLETAGYYTGLGTVGRSHQVLTEAYGSRFQLKAVFTDAELEGDPIYQKDLCIQCGNCEKICPAHALGPDGQKDEEQCRLYVRRLEQAYCDCSACIKVCPVGADRQLFNCHDVEKYFNEEKASEYRSWVHIRSYGSADPAAVPADE